MSDANSKSNSNVSQSIQQSEVLDHYPDEVLDHYPDECLQPNNFDLDNLEIKIFNNMETGVIEKGGKPVYIPAKNMTLVSSVCYNTNTLKVLSSNGFDSIQSNLTDNKYVHFILYLNNNKNSLK